MKLRVTPLNIISSVAFALFVLSFFQSKSASSPVDVSGFYKLILGCLVLVTFITDLVFRATIKDLKRIWIVEMTFIIITVVLMVIIRKLA